MAEEQLATSSKEPADTDPAVSVDQVAVAAPDDNNADEDSAPEAHQALDVAKLEESVAKDTTRAKIRPALSKAKSKTSGSFRQATTREERFQSMVKQAEGKARKDRLGEGLKGVFQATMDDIGALGIGMQLYFMLTKYLSVAFLCMGIIALPAIMENTYGHGITSKTVDPLQLAYASIGNGGVDSDTAATPRSCLPIGDIDCTWKTVDTPMTSNPRTVTWIITFTDVLYTLFFIGILLLYSYRARKAIKAHQNKHLTPARYAVLVRGLPKDATEKEIMEHFNKLYDPTKDEEYSKLWFGFYWGKRQKVKNSRRKKAANYNVVSNVDHLEGSTTITKELYLNTWIAEVSVAHPTGGLLRTFLSMESLAQKRTETQLLIQTLEEEKSHSLADFRSCDEQLIHTSKKKLARIEKRLNNARNKIKLLKDVIPPSARALEKKLKKENRHNLTSTDKLKLAAQSARKAAMKTEQKFNWEACECAFVVFNNLESRRRCLQDYRQSTRRLARKYQPKELRFRNGSIPLIVTPAPEPSNIIWENLEVTNRGRLYRQAVTTFVTVVLLFISCVIISAAQSTQAQFANKMPPSGLCDRSLPAVFYGDTAFTMTSTKKAIPWTLAWDSKATCDPGTAGDTRYHIAYTNGIVNAYNASKESFGAAYPNPTRCVDPCISESSDQTCNTLPCFYYNQLVKTKGMTCQAYSASHVLYCFCSSALTSSIQTYGFIDGPKSLWNNIPCRGFTKDYLIKNAFIVLAAAIVVIVNFLLDNILRMFAVFERHTSESARTITVAVRMFGAQFLNTALIVIVVNASLGLNDVPVAGELLNGKYKDFERGWYPTVGMGITTTMLLNAFLPQITLFGQMYVVSPIYRWYKRRSVRTQAKMDKLYAGPTFDISERYPMVLNSVFVTMVFCGGSPVLLFIAAVTTAGMYWFDKLSILHLYSVKTTYDEMLGEVTLQALPWTLVLHLGFSAWMYGNTDLLKGTMIDLPWLLRSVGLSNVLRENPNATTDELYAILTKKIGQYDVLKQYGILVKIIYSHVLLMTIFFFVVVIGLLLYLAFGRLVFVVLGQMAAFVKQVLMLPVELLRSEEARDREREKLQKKQKLPLVLQPEFTEPFLMSVSKKYRPEDALGFQKSTVDNTEQLVCVWPEDVEYANGLTRATGEQKLTWETMQAPVKSYAIEANEKYSLAVEQISAAWQLVVNARAPQPVRLGKVTPMPERLEHNQIEAAVTATEPVATTKEDGGKLAPEGDKAEEVVAASDVEDNNEDNNEELHGSDFE